MITYEMLRVLHNNCVAGRKATRTWEKQFAKVGAKIGNIVQIRKPPLYTVTKGATFQDQGYQELMVPLTITEHDQVGVEFANDDMTLSMDDFSGRVLSPAMVPLANSVDTFILQTIYKMVWNAVGTPGTPAATDTPFLLARTLLTNNAAPPPDFCMLVNPIVSALLSSGLAGRFNPQGAISKLYEEGSMDNGYMGKALGWDYYETQNMPVFTTGAWAAAVANTGIQVDGADQTGSSVLLKGAAVSVAGLGKQGDVIQFDGVYMVNPITKLNTGVLQNFVLTADCDSDGGGAVTVQISPSIILAGKNQTVSAAPADSAQVYVWGTARVADVASKVSPQMMGWQKEAVTLACVDLAMPGKQEGVMAVRASDDDLGLSILYMRGFDIRQYSNISRLDILYGATAPRPEHVVRVAS